MLKWILGIVLALAGAIALGLMLASDQGLVRIFHGGDVVEMTLATFLAAAILLLALLWLVKAVIMAVLTAPERLRAAARRRRLARGREAQMNGLIQIAEGHWDRGERQLIKHANDAETPLINYLAAARAAQLLGADERRDIYLKAAYESTPEATKAVLLTQADLQMSHRQYEHALATLKRIQEIEPGHAFALRLLAKAYVELGDWHGVENLLPRLRKARGINPKVIEDLEQQSLGAAVRNAGGRGISALDGLWKTTPRRLRRDAVIVAAFARAYMDANGHDQAESMLRDALKSNWDADLVLLYGDVRSSQIEKQIGRVESWLKSRGDSAELLAAASSLCAAASLWGKARGYLETSLRLKETPRSYQRLGRLLQELGQPEAAMQAYRKGLEMCPVGSKGPTGR